MKSKSRDREPVDLGESLPEQAYEALSPTSADRRKREEASSIRSFFGANAGTVQEEIVELQLDRLEASPYQPRSTIDPEKMDELKESIRERGVITPILVRRIESGRFELIAGARRAEASRTLGRATIPAIVRKYNDEEAEYLALIDNIHRQDLGVIEQAKSFARLIERHKLTHEDLAKQLKCSRTKITRMLKVLELPPEVQSIVFAPGLEFGGLHGELLASVKQPNKCLRLAEKMVAERWSTRRLEDEIKRQPRQHKGYESVVLELREDGFNLRINFRDNHPYDIPRSREAIAKALTRLTQSEEGKILPIEGPPVQTEE